MQFSKSNAAQARSILREAIHSGSFSRGAQLPSTRELAEQFDINRNTATKIYHELADENLVRLVPNKPPVVIGGIETSAEASLHQRVRETLWTLLHESQLMGVSPAETTRLLNDVAYDFFATHRVPRIYVAECNDVEARAYAQELTLKLETVVRPLLLDQLDSLTDADIVIAPFFHLQEVRQKVQHRIKHVVGLVVTADSADIAKVAAMVNKGPLGIVAVNLGAAERLRRLLGFQIDAPMLIASPDHPHTIEGMRGNVECIVCTARADSDSWSKSFNVPMTRIRYHAGEDSIDVLRDAIQRLGPIMEQTSA